ncbi:MAG: diacylglycerol kinase family protein [Elusimicrobiota bacterium]
MTNIDRLDIVATTMSGSIKDWGKIERMGPLFEKEFPGKVRMHVVDSHEEARKAARQACAEGSRVVVSAGGAGTFNRVVQGVLEGAKDLGSMRLGFLRKGSADLIGKALGVSDVVEESVRQISEGIRSENLLPCDVIRVSEDGNPETRNFVGFGGLETVGDIPYFTESFLIKYYKGILGYFFGDLGPFRVGTTLAVATWMTRKFAFRQHRFRLSVDGKDLPGDRYISILLINGDLGPDMPFYRGCSLGAGEFYLLALRDLGLGKIPGQAVGSFNGDVLKEPARWGMETRVVKRELRVVPLMDPPRPFRVNIDGLKWSASFGLSFKLSGKLNLISARKRG